MKSKNLLIAASVALMAIGYTSCKKDTSSSTQEEKDATVQLSQDQAVADNITEDANDMFMAAADDKGLMGKRPSKDPQERPTDVTGLPACAIVTVSPEVGFPKTIEIDFGIVCTSPNDIIRSGKINIVISDTVRKTGSTATITFTNYFVNGYKVEGKINWTNTSTQGTRSWTRTVVDGKITAPNGTRYWNHNGTRQVVQTAGINTPLFLADDIFSITGTHTVSNAAGNSRTSTIIEPLQKKTICENIDKGTIKVQGPNHYAIIDFGDGTCDRVATIAFDGGNPITFFLR